MWFIVNDGGSRRIPLLPEKEYIIGRKDCDIILDSDQSISRRHASVKVSHAGAVQSQITESSPVILTDLSKFGTQVNDENLNGSSRTLHAGDVLAFGQYKIALRVVFEPFEVTTSCLDSAAKRTLQAVLRDLGIRLVKEWQQQSTTHLIMSRITVTPKTVCCLIEQRPIVTPEFFTEFLKACQERRQLPSVDSYSPELADSQVDPLMVSFKPNPLRATLFNGKKFIFMQRREFVLLSQVIALAGGRCLLMEGQPRPPANSGELVSAGSIVVHADERDAALSHEAKKWIVEASRLLRRHNRRMVQEAEIGYAVLYGSTDRYCNPDREAGRELLLSMSQSVTSSQQPLAVASQSTLPEKSLPLPLRATSEGKSALAVTTVPSSVTSTDEQDASFPVTKRGPLREDVTDRGPSKSSARAANEQVQGASHLPIGAPGQSAGLASTSTAVGKAAPVSAFFANALNYANATLQVDPNSSARPSTPAATKVPAPTLPSPAGDRVMAVPTAAFMTPIVATGCREPGAEAVAIPELTRQTEAIASADAAAVATLASAAHGTSAVIKGVKRARSTSPLAAEPCHGDRVTRPLVEQLPPSARHAIVKQEVVDGTEPGYYSAELPQMEAGQSRSSATYVETLPRPVGNCVHPGRADLIDTYSATGCTTGDDLAPEDGGVNVLATSLVRRNVPAPLLATDRDSSGLTLWNGKWVKNFKRFVKCGQRELDHLPRIIGGGDLVGAASLKRSRPSDASEDYGRLQLPAAVHGSASSTTTAATGRGLTQAYDDDDEDMEIPSHQSRVNAIFDRFAVR